MTAAEPEYGRLDRILTAPRAEHDYEPMEADEVRALWMVGWCRVCGGAANDYRHRPAVVRAELEGP